MKYKAFKGLWREIDSRKADVCDPPSDKMYYAITNRQLYDDIAVKLYHELEKHLFWEYMEVLYVEICTWKRI